MLVFDRPPKTLYEDVIQGPTSTIHADLDTMRKQRSREAWACKLAPLVAVEYLTTLVLQQTTYRLYAKIGVQGRAKLPV